MGMKYIIDILLILGFLAIDFLFFHDFFKAGEVITTAQYLTGVLSLIVIGRSVYSLSQKHA